MTYANNNPELEREPLDLTTTFCEIARQTVEELFANMLTMLGDLPGYTEVKYDAQNSNFMWAIPKTPSPIALVAHLDIVGKKPPQEFDIRSGIIKTKGGGILGADDRAGLLAILAILSRGYTPTIYLTTGEETGGIGSRDLAKRHTPPTSTNVLIEFDRKGYNDFVTYSNHSPLCNEYFERFGFEKAQGSYTDIETLQKEWKIAGVNLSIGYYSQHTQSETLFIPQAAHTIDRACEMLDNPPTERLPYITYTAPAYNAGYVGRHYNNYEIGGFKTVNGLAGGRAYDPETYRYRYWNYTTKEFQDSDCYNCQVDAPNPDGIGTSKLWAIKGADNKPITYAEYPAPPKETTSKTTTNDDKGKGGKNRKANEYRKSTDEDLRVTRLSLNGWNRTQRPHSLKIIVLTDRNKILPALLHRNSDTPATLGSILYIPHLKEYGTVTGITRSVPNEPPPENQPNKGKKKKAKSVSVPVTTNEDDTQVITDAELIDIETELDGKEDRLALQKQFDQQVLNGAKKRCSACRLNFPIEELDHHDLCYRCEKEEQEFNQGIRLLGW